MPHLQYPKIGLVTPHNLQSHRQPLIRKPAGTEAAGFPVVDIYQQDFIQSM